MAEDGARKPRRRRPKGRGKGLLDTAAVSSLENRQSSADPFIEMAQSARTADTSAPAGTPELASRGKFEIYGDEFQLTQAAHRRMRGWAFVVIGVLTTLYLLVLLCVLWRFFDGRLIASILGVPGGPLDWHVLVLVGIALVIFAAIPLSFAMALVKMISDRDAEDETRLRMPSTELGKVLVDLFKSMAAAAKN